MADKKKSDGVESKGLTVKPDPDYLPPHEPEDPNPPEVERTSLKHVNPDTPSGAALHEVGLPPKGADLTSDTEIKRGQKYAAAKHIKRWLR